jgi:hypothetical protein
VDAKQYSSESIGVFHERFKDFSVARGVIQEELVHVSGDFKEIGIHF